MRRRMHLIKEIPNFDEIFKQIILNFWFLGIPLSKAKLKYRFYFHIFLLSVILVEESLFFFSKFSHENFLELTQLAPCICIGTLSIAKIALISRKRNDILELSESLKKLYQIMLQDNNKRIVVYRDFVFLKYLIKYFFILNAVLIGVYNFSTLFMLLYWYYTKNLIVLNLPYAVLVPISTDLWYNWLLVYLHSIVSGFTCILFFTTVDALYFIMTTHVCSQFLLLSDEIKKLDANTVFNLDTIIKKHQHIIKLSEDLENIFSTSNLFNVLVGSIEICALGFNLTRGQWNRIPGVVLFLLSVLLQILMISVYGETLIRESRKIGEAAYLCQWYTMDNVSKRTILLIIVRSQRAQVLTAYKYSVISYESFTKIISTAWSYFTILKTIYTPYDA